MKNAGGRRIWIRRIKVCVLILLCVVMGFLWFRTFQERKVIEAELAARENVTEQEDEAKVLLGDTVEYQGKTYKRNTYVKAILCMGVDRKGSMQETTTAGSGGQADGVFLVAQDTARNQMKILMIPRDTMTDIILTDLRGNVLGKGLQHLTLAYAYGDGREKSCEYMSEAVSDLLGGFELDQYLAVDISVISVLNDSVGGVTVTVPTAGMEKVNPQFEEGAVVTLHGDEAEQFVRYRDIEQAHSALYRMDQQQEYIEQFFHTVQEKSRTDSSLIADMFSSIEEYMITDMGKDQYLKLAASAIETEDFSGADIYTLPGSGVTTGRYDEFYPDMDKMTALVLKLFYREIT